MTGGLFSGDASTSASVLILGILAGVVAQLVTYLTVRFNAKQARAIEAQRRAWDIEDRKATAALAAEQMGDAVATVAQHVKVSGDRLAAAIADNTRKTEGAALAAREAFHEANHVNEKIASLGLRALDGSLRLVGPAERVFVVDDNTTSLKLTRLVLLGAGYLVETVTSAEDALEELGVKGRILPDLILIDLDLPKMDGCALATELRGRGLTMPMIAHTGFAVDPQRCYDAGFDGFVEKSGDTDMLPRILSQHLRIQRLQQQHQEPIPRKEKPPA